MRLNLSTRVWALDPPFIIAGAKYSALEALVVEIVDEEGCRGFGETLGVDYLGETVGSIIDQIESVRGEIEAGVSIETLQNILPAGGARNGIDLALWDLQSKKTGRSVASLIGICEVRPILTAVTIGLMSAQDAKKAAEAAPATGIIKIKADADNHVDIIAAVRSVRPDSTLIIDANQSWTWDMVEELTDDLVRLKVSVLEQPLPRGADAALVDYDGPLLLMADESCQSSADMSEVLERYQGVNIKLDKTGGLTEALHLYKIARENCLKTMVGNMCGGSMAMAPGLILGQMCDYADLDGPLLQVSDWDHPLRYADGVVSPSKKGIWGGV